MSLHSAFKSLTSLFRRAASKTDELKTDIQAQQEGTVAHEEPEPAIRWSHPWQQNSVQQMLYGAGEPENQETGGEENGDTDIPGDTADQSE